MNDFVEIERRGDAVVLRPVTCRQLESLAEIGKYLAEKFPVAEESPEPLRTSPLKQSPL